MSPLEMETSAIVLDCRDYGESDKIVTFLCPKAGRLSGLAKGAKRSKRRFVNKLELFSLLHLTYSLPRHGELAFIAAAELQASFLSLRHSVGLYNAATVIRECTLMGTSEKERSEKAFEILLWALRALDRKQPSHTVVILFLIRFFEYIGYRPDLLHCHHCGRSTATERTSEFNYMTGCLICEACSRHSLQTTVPLSLGTIKLLANAQSQPLERLHRLQFSLRAREESLNMLHHFGRQLFQRDIHSWKALLDPEGAGLKARYS
ncbi:MAG: DNA repair protein RecO [Desulfocapsaceae bacterium]|nr:DNA repair protein RecO [Desulfocapsaceae bacterium]